MMTPRRLLPIARPGCLGLMFGGRSGEPPSCARVRSAVVLPVVIGQHVKRKLSTGVLDPTARLSHATRELGVHWPGTRRGGRRG